MVRNGLMENGFMVKEVRYEGEWVCIIAEVSHA
jgi:ribosomal protein L11 methyltransferase